MQQYGLGTAYRELPRWAKGILAVGATAAVVALIFTIKKALSKVQGVKDLNTWKGEANQLEKKYTPSYSQAQYTAFANQIYEGIKYGIGDDYGLVQTILKRMKNDLDVAKLVAAYGQRQRYAFGIAIGDPIDLFTTMQAELGSEYGGLTNYRIKDINQDWNKKGITYTL